jgi:hypothetical protein
MDVDLKDSSCWKKLDISSSAYQEIKHRLGFKGRITLDQFNEIEKVVDVVRKRYESVTLGTINIYWEYMMKEEKKYGEK